MRHVTLAAVAVLTCSALPAAAQDAVSESDERFENGAALYMAQKYSEAILEFRRGYDLAPHPIFLVNIALAYAKLQNYGDASRWGQRAIDEEGLDASAAAQTAARVRAWDLHGTTAKLAIVEPVVVVQNPEPDPVPVEPPRSGRPLRWTAIGAAGLGVIGLGAAGVIGATLQDDKREYEAAAAAGNEARYLELQDRIDGQQSLGRVLLFSGAGLVALGVTLFVVDQATEAHAVIGPDGAEFRVVYSFR